MTKRITPESNDYAAQLDAKIKQFANEIVKTQACREAAGAAGKDPFPQVALAYAMIGLLVSLECKEDTWFGFLRGALNEAITTEMGGLAKVH